ncbi:hypothetical protein PYCCODRAFT_1435695 [Trametes coccinea BRFM310]|uniref:Lysine decarboxylase-like protein n=1 Tax=Trametes coccinea (strain BRFM310) TaxID=1353009 RepID=A0A1Y2IMV2_TRAC3|nr:hypothetical protein PYCCODRAFT_1435695 [Trametes coccinea BRFM310]
MTHGLSALSSWLQRGPTRGHSTKAPARATTTTRTDALDISAPFNVAMTFQNKEPETRAVTVFCGSSKGNHPAYLKAAQSLGKALAESKRPLVYGGGSAGIMGAVSGAVLEHGGEVTGVTPYAMVAAGGEVDQSQGIHKPHIQLKEKGREKVETIVVNSMHERKAEMAKRSCGFIGLPGGYGTFEEVLEVACWSQVGIHSKPVIVLNVRGFWNPLRELIRNGIREGFIVAKNEQLVQFVEGPEDHAEHETFDWGKAAMETLDHWQGVQASHFYNWHLRKDGRTEEDALGAS